MPFIEGIDTVNLHVYFVRDQLYIMCSQRLLPTVGIPWTPFLAVSNISGQSCIITLLNEMEDIF